MTGTELALAAYLATHDRPVPTDTLRCALWPLDEDGHDIAYATFKQAVSRARAALGEDSTGAKHLPDAHDGTGDLMAERDRIARQVAARHARVVGAEARRELGELRGVHAGVAPEAQRAVQHGRSREPHVVRALDEHLVERLAVVAVRVADEDPQQRALRGPDHDATPGTPPR